MKPFNSTGENNNQIVNPPVYLSPYKNHGTITRYFSTPQKSLPRSENARVTHIVASPRYAVAKK
ncbi:MAG: hypothetical protein GY820_25575 [Gammaproteobacteria bacterium]|nr:hypothetical protein [Gammaproteobacteria bacterium]